MRRGAFGIGSRSAEQRSSHSDRLERGTRPLDPDAANVVPDPSPYTLRYVVRGEDATLRAEGAAEFQLDSSTPNSHRAESGHEERRH